MIMRDFADFCNRFYDFFAGQPQIAKAGLKFRFAAPPVVSGNRKTAIRHLAEGLVHPSGEKYRRRIPATLALLHLRPVFTKLTPPLAILAICISVFHFLSP
jgi:hypothetical protein